jgi:hypothetical protein
LVELLLGLAQADRGVLRQLTARLEVAASSDELATATRQAIADATSFDRRDIGRNFAYDAGAYGEVKGNLGRLVAGGELRLALALALELMKQGSYQVEMSDEGLMSDEIEDCLGVVIAGLKECELPAPEVVDWCAALQAADLVGFLARESLESLCQRSQQPRVR